MREERKKKKKKFGKRVTRMDQLGNPASAAIAVALSAHERQSINHIMFAFKIRIIMFPPI